MKVKIGANNMGNRVIYWIIVVISVLTLVPIAYQGIRIYRAKKLTYEKSLIVVDDPSAADASLELSPAKDGYVVRGCKSVRLLNAGSIKALKEGGVLAGNSFLLFGNAVYEYIPRCERENWVTIYNRQITVNANRSISVGDGNNNSSNIIIPNIRGTAATINALGRDMSERAMFEVQAHQSGIKLIRWNKEVVLNANESATAFSGSLIEVNGKRLKVFIEERSYPKDKEAITWERGYFMRIDMSKNVGDTGFKENPAWLSKLGYYLKDGDIPDSKGINPFEDDTPSCIRFLKRAGGGIALKSECSFPGTVYSGISPNIIKPNEELNLSQDAEIVAGDIVIGISLLEDGYLFEHLSGKDKESIPLPISNNIIIVGRGKLFRNYFGSYIPDSFDRIGYARETNLLLDNKNSDGFIIPKHDEVKDLHKNSIIFYTSYNRLRFPSGILVKGTIRYRGSDGNVNEIPLNTLSGWESSIDGRSWSPVEPNWKWHPLIQLYRDTKFSGMQWMWHKEAWNPQYLKEGIERFFRLRVNVPSEAIARFMVLSDSDFRLSVNESETNGREEENKPFKSRASEQSLQRGENIIKIEVNKTLTNKASKLLKPFVFKDEYGVFPNEQEANALADKLRNRGETNVEIEDVTIGGPLKSVVVYRENDERTLKLLRGVNSMLMRVYNVRKKREEPRGLILDRDSESIPRLVVEKGNFMLPEGTEIMLDNIQPSIRERLRDNSSKLIIFVGDDRTYKLLDGNTCRGNVASYRRGGNMYVNRNMFTTDGQLVNGRGDWIIYNSHQGKMLTGDIIIIDRGDGKVRQLEMRNNGSNCVTGNGDWQSYLRFIINATGVRVSGRGFSVIRANEISNTEGNLPLRNGDMIHLNSEGIAMRYVEGGGILGGNKVVNGDLERFYPQNTGLFTIVGSSTIGVKAGIEKVFDRILSGDYDKEKKNISLTIDDDLQRMVQMEFEREIYSVEAEALRNGAKGKFFEGALILLDAYTGEILASATYPVTEYDGAKIEDAIDFDLVEGSKSSIANRGWKLRKFHPGSTFKIITATAALSALDSEDNDYKNPIVDMINGKRLSGYNGTRLDNITVLPVKEGLTGECISSVCNARVENNNGGNFPGGYTIEDAIENSINTYFGYLALLMNKPLRSGQMQRDQMRNVYAGDEMIMKEMFPLQYYAERFGFNKRFDLLPEGFDNIYPFLQRDGSDILYTDMSIFPYDNYKPGLIAQVGIGQAEIEVTPLQQALVAATVRNNGTRPYPSLIKKVAGIKPTLRNGETIIEKEWLRRIQTGMNKVVLDGTARDAFINSNLREMVYAKTGTAQRGRARKDSFFIGFVMPQMDGNYENVEGHHIAFASVIGEAGYGGVHSAKVVERVLRRVGRYYGWQ